MARPELALTSQLTGIRRIPEREVSYRRFGLSHLDQPDDFYQAMEAATCRHTSITATSPRLGLLQNRYNPFPRKALPLHSAFLVGQILPKTTLKMHQKLVAVHSESEPCFLSACLEPKDRDRLSLLSSHTLQFPQHNVKVLILLSVRA